MYRAILFLAALGLLAGCAANPAQPFTADDEVEEARSDMEESKRDYELCLHDQEEEVDIDCEVFKEIYEEDREAYENLLKLRQRARP